MNREQKIIRVSWWTIFGNAALALLKLFTGILANSYAVIADGIDSAMDIGSSVVVLLAARVISRPPNIRFAYGYLKADTIAAKILSFVIFFAGAQLAWSTLSAFYRDRILEIPSGLAIWITFVSIAGKLVLTLILRRTGKKTESQMLIANAKNMRNDILISAGVLAGLVVTVTLKQPMIDRIIALLISVFIMYTAIRIFLRAHIDLMDGIDDPQLYEQLFQAIRQVPGAHHPHRVRARKIGALYMVNLDIEVDGSLTVKAAHDIARKVEQSIKESLHNIYDIMVHVEPMGNRETDEKYGISESEINHLKR